MNIDGSNPQKLREGATDLYCFLANSGKIYYAYGTSEEASELPYGINYS